MYPPIKSANLDIFGCYSRPTPSFPLSEGGRAKFEKQVNTKKVIMLQWGEQRPSPPSVTIEGKYP